MRIIAPHSHTTPSPALAAMRSGPLVLFALLAVLAAAQLWLAVRSAPLCGRVEDVPCGP